MKCVFALFIRTCYSLCQKSIVVLSRQCLFLVYVVICVICRFIWYLDLVKIESSLRWSICSLLLERKNYRCMQFVTGLLLLLLLIPLAATAVCCPFCIIFGGYVLLFSPLTFFLFFLVFFFSFVRREKEKTHNI